jgi:hypothetical protein
MRFADGRVITGVSKEKSEAAHEYKNAISAGKASGLVDWVTNDSQLRHSLTIIDTHSQFSVCRFTRVYPRKGDSNCDHCVCYGSDG